MKKNLQGVLVVMLLGALNLTTTHAQGTAFTYQGRLNNGTNVASGSYDLRFGLFSLASGGSQIGSLVTNVNTAISNGLFTVTLDFGSQFSAGLNRWIEIAVRSNTAPAFTVLAPRQQLTPTPYAIFAGGVNSSTIVGQLVSSSLGGIYSGFITMNNAGNVFAGDGAGLTALNASQLTSGTVPGAALGGAWKTNGNAGANPLNGVFLGTTDNQPLELKVKATRSLRIEPTLDTPNLIGGYSNNVVTNGFYGAFIGGGGSAAYGANRIANNYSAILGGFDNIASGNGSFVVGLGCVASGDGSVAMNDTATASGPDSLATGISTLASGSAATAICAGGQATGIASLTTGNATIASGNFSTAMGYVTLASGDNSLATGNGSHATGVNATAMGELTIASGNDSTAMGGSTMATNLAATAMGANTVSGGVGSTAMGVFSKATGDFSTATGIGSIANGYGSFSAGRENISGGTNATAIGSKNTANGDFSVAMGYSNNASLFYATAIGYGNVASGNSSIALGFQNTASSGTAMGTQCSSTSFGCMAFGNLAVAAHPNSFVWNDNSAGSFSSTGIRQFLIHAAGGVGINTASPASALHVNGTVTATAFNPTSDRNAKENFTPVSPGEVLAKVAALPISRWNFKGDTSASHVGPMAQDFRAAFGLGTDERHIATVDADGVAFAAIQGLNEKVETQSAELKQKENEITELKARLEKLEQLLTTRK